MKIHQIFVKLTPGDDIEDTCKEAIKLAQDMEASVIFRFNGVLLEARSDTEVEHMVKAYDARLDSLEWGQKPEEKARVIAELHAKHSRPPI